MSSFEAAMSIGAGQNLKGMGMHAMTGTGGVQGSIFAASTGSVDIMSFTSCKISQFFAPVGVLHSVANGGLVGVMGHKGEASMAMAE